MARPVIEPRSTCFASQELNHSATAAPKSLYMGSGFNVENWPQKKLSHFCVTFQLSVNFQRSEGIIFQQIFSRRMTRRVIFQWGYIYNVTPAFPVAVLFITLLCSKKNRVCHRQNGVILIKYKYKDWIVLLISHSVMKDRGSTCKFRKALRALRNLHMDRLTFILVTMRNISLKH